MYNLELALGGVLDSDCDDELAVVEGLDKVEMPSRLDSVWNLFFTGMFGIKLF